MSKMDRDYTDTNMQREGNLADLPLAMAYVRWQPWENTYDTETALRRGTIFPGLDLPFLAYRGCQDEQR